ncbi:MAG: acyltransferase [Armatimonadetes bacterium]|nr:MAG: acyltransferase [Armatimonadota bacterium]
MGTIQRNKEVSRLERRELTFDILKGFAILEVISHHTLGLAARRYVEEGSFGWWLILLLNRTLHFAVPTFLLVSALLLARSLAKKDQLDWAYFLKRRFWRTGYPYLVWTAIYLALRGGVPEIGLGATLVWGKGHYHLYFLAVLLEVSLLFPLIFLAIRRWRPSLPLTLAVAAGVQVGVYVSNYYLRYLPYPGSSALFYLFPVILGVWLGVHWEDWRPVWVRYRYRLVQWGTAAFGLYMIAEVCLLVRVPVGEFPYFWLFRIGPAALLLYATAAGLLLIRVSEDVAEHSRMRAVLAQIGDRSLGLFLIHPLFLYLIQGPKVTAFLNRLPIPALWAIALVFLLSWIAVEATQRAGLSRWLYGREFLPLGAYSRRVATVRGMRRRRSTLPARPGTPRFHPTAASVTTRSPLPLPPQPSSRK